MIWSSYFLLSVTSFCPHQIWGDLSDIFYSTEKNHQILLNLYVSHKQANIASRVKHWKSVPSQQNKKIEDYVSNQRNVSNQQYLKNLLTFWSHTYMHTSKVKKVCHPQNFILYTYNKVELSTSRYKLFKYIHYHNYRYNVYITIPLTH